MAWGIAVAADLIQWVGLPFFVVGGVALWNDVLDILVGMVLIRLLGWHWSFVPTFLVELFPVVDIAPTWTLAVLLATRRRRALRPGKR